MQTLLFSQLLPPTIRAPVLYLLRRTFKNNSGAVRPGLWGSKLLVELVHR